MEHFYIAQSDIYIIFTALIGFFATLVGVRTVIDMAKRG